MNQYNNNFTDLMLKELIKHGYSGEELLNEYKKAQSAIKPAINALLEEAIQNHAQLL